MAGIEMLAPSRSGIHSGVHEAQVSEAKRGRKEETQDRIVAAALELFATRGYKGTSITAIAARARVSRAAVFWHFSDKETLFREMFRRMLLPFFAELQASLEDFPPRERVFEILSAYERVVQEHEPAVRSIVGWLFESKDLQASLLDTLFALHDALVRDLAETLAEAGGDEEGSLGNAAALVALLDGNLLLAMLDPSARNRTLRSEGLRQLTRLAMGEHSG